MVKISNFKFQLVLLACLFALYSCDKVEDATKTEIPAFSASIELDDIIVSATKSTADDDLINFSASQVVKLEDIDGISEDAIKYRSNIESVSVGSASVLITTTDSVGTVVKEFKLSATDISSSINITEYELGTTHTADLENLQTFCNQLFMKLFSSDSGVKISTSGLTDITSGEKLKVTITMENITLIASLL